ncbi:acylneuraminate cytidylyltransferase family protein [Citrobacter freundii]|uniref:acylneuraminate cytidylyltransferase family protein n=1 Tax=Citrobacter sp. Cm038 TaxID=2985117 RepID=UPI0024DE66E1|nr:MULTISPECIES: acylneuraminate cytidylyltransferase family protein [Citrobacter]MDK2361703.1 acylneuraminate cytidylyltransferase family protein [Citrobacter freundii]MDM2943072.1 acylneuraminate cytidylyltransferase family protein [Citrobacter sp. Cm038]
MRALNVAIIPARAGSKRLPGKNIKLLAGKPLIVWTIEAAITSNLFDVILVTTDSEEIANIARAAGASVPFLRPSELSTDTSSTNEVISHAVDWIEQNVGTVSCVTLLQPTSPLRTADDIAQAMNMYDTKQASAIVSVCLTEHPIQFCNTLPIDLSMAGFIKTQNNKRSQELEPSWRLNGAIYIFDRKYVSNLTNLYEQNTFAYIMKRESSIDIDQELDFILAEIILSKPS